VRISHIDVPAVLTAEQLESLRFRLLKPSHGTLIEQNTLVTCDGKLKALFLQGVLRDETYRYALRGLRLMKFKPAKDSDRKSIMQDLIGSDLLLGWLRPRCPSREDWLRKGDRDQLFFAMRLVLLLRDFEFVMQRIMPDYLGVSLGPGAAARASSGSEAQDAVPGERPISEGDAPAMGRDPVLPLLRNERIFDGHAE
jgi:hypothetical protein